MDGPTSSKFKQRNKASRMMDSDLKVTGHRKTDIDRRMILEMKDHNKKQLMGDTGISNTTITFNGAISKKKNSTML